MTNGFGEARSVTNGLWRYSGEVKSRVRGKTCLMDVIICHNILWGGKDDYKMM